MKNFKEYINPQVWDGRNNIIGSVNQVPQICWKTICSVDPFIKNQNKYDLIQDFIQTKYNPNRHIILASGRSITDLEKSINIPECSGVGEIFIWKHYLGHTGLSTVSNYNYLDLLSDYDKPIYIHWDMNRGDEWNRFESFLKNHFGPVILCHLGINNIFSNQRSTIAKFKRLQRNYENLWGEISWDALDYLYKYPDQIRGAERVFTASDLIPGDNPKRRSIQMMSLKDIVHSDENIKKLFNLNLN